MISQIHILQDGQSDKFLCNAIELSSKVSQLEILFVHQIIQRLKPSLNWCTVHRKIMDWLICPLILGQTLLIGNAWFISYLLLLRLIIMELTKCWWLIMPTFDLIIFNFEWKGAVYSLQFSSWNCSNIWPENQRPFVWPQFGFSSLELFVIIGWYVFNPCWRLAIIC